MSKTGSGPGTARSAVLDRTGLEAYLKRTVAMGQELSLVVTGQSMAPLLRHLKDRVLLASPDSMGVRRLDIVLFRREDGKYVLHRIVRCLADGEYRINGDAQLWTERISRRQIQAVVKEIDRNGKKIGCRNHLYRWCAGIWVCLKPLRGIGIRIYRRLKGAFWIKNRQDMERWHDKTIL